MMMDEPKSYPLWVVWRSGGDYYGWAPMQPTARLSTAMSPDYYTPADWWVFIPRTALFNPAFTHSYKSAANNIAILKSTPEKQEAAWLFLRWLMRDKIAATWTQTSGVLPARLAARQWLKDYFVKVPQQQQAMDDLLPVAHAVPNIRPAPEVHDLIDGALNLYEGSKTSAQTALDAAAAKATVLLNEKK